MENISGKAPDRKSSQHAENTKTQTTEHVAGRARVSPSPRPPLPLHKQNLRLLTPKEYAKRAQKRPSLGIYAKFDSTASISHPPLTELGGSSALFLDPASLLSVSVIPESGLVRRFWLQSTARDLMRRYGQADTQLVCKCLRSRIPVQATVDLLYSSLRTSAHYKGLQVCASVWACPVCAAKISERRRVELQQGLANWRAADGYALLVTFTLSHDRDHSLTSVLAMLQRARKLVLGGREGMAFRDRFPYVGMVRSLEVTYGANGWHPHMHVLYFFRSPVDVALFTHELKSRWAGHVAGLGGFASYEHGVDVRFTNEDVAAYVAKWGHEPSWTAAHELAKAPVKRGRRGGYTPHQLLILAALGWPGAGGFWFEYAVNFKGEKQLRWSNGMRVACGLAATEKTDGDLAEEEQDAGALLLAQLNSDEWRIILAQDARAELLQVGASGDVEQVYAFLERLGIFRSE